jgi:hypothetical protein
LIEISNVKPINDFMEEAIGLPLEEGLIEKYQFSIGTLESIYEKLNEYNCQFFAEKGQISSHGEMFFVGKSPIFPHHTEAELWPGFFHQRTVIKKNILSQEVTSHPNGLSDTLKKILMFSHGVFIQNPTFLHPDGRFSLEECLKLAKRSLTELAEIKRLTARKIVVPVPHIFFWGAVEWDEMLDKGHGDFQPDDITTRNILDISNNVRRAIPGIKRVCSRNAVIQALLAQRHSSRHQSYFDPLLFDSNDATAYGETIKYLGRRISSESKLSPLMLQKISTTFAINSGKITVKDLENIRDNEEIFSEWRRIVSLAMMHLVKNQDSYNDDGMELAYFLRHNQAEWRSASEKIIGKGAVADFVDLGKEAAASFTAGVVAGAFFEPTKTWYVNGTAAAVPSLIKIFSRLMPMNSKKISFRNHLLSIGAKI